MESIVPERYNYCTVCVRGFQKKPTCASYDMLLGNAGTIPKRLEKVGKFQFKVIITVMMITISLIPSKEFSLNIMAILYAHNS